MNKFKVLNNKQITKNIINSVANPEKYFEEIPGLTLLASFDESRKASDREKAEEESSEKKV